MSNDPLAAHSTNLLRALDFAAEAAAQEGEHREEMMQLLGSLLDVVDSFDRYLGGEQVSATNPADLGGRSTVRLIARQLERVLEQAGVTSIVCLGQDFDPERQECVELRQTKGVPEAKIVEVVTRGFDWKGRTLRRPRVVVAREGE